MSLEYIYIPIVLKKELWELSDKTVFLGDYYINQLDKDEKLKIKNLKKINSYKKEFDKYELDTFVTKLRYALSTELNYIHNVKFDSKFWFFLWSSWLEHFVVNIIDKVQILSEVTKQYGDIKIKSSSYVNKLDNKFLDVYGGLFFNQEFNDYIFTIIAERYFNFEISYKHISKNESNDIFSEEKHFAEKKINLMTFVKKILKKTYRFVFSNNQQQLLLWCTYFDDDAIRYFYKKSGKKIGVLNFTDSKFHVSFNKELRNLLILKVKSYFDYSKITIYERVVLDLLEEFIPFFYIENFSNYLNYSVDFLNKKKKLKCIFATCLYCKEIEPFFIAYAQSRGIKVFTEQHGGDYGLRKYYHNKEANMSDSFYGWGKWTNDAFCSKSKMINSPSYRLHLLFDNKSLNSKYILYVGSSIFFHITNPFLYFVGHTGYQNYIDFQKKFFHLLNKEVLANTLVRLFWIDFGFHLDKILTEDNSAIKIQGYKQKDYNENCDTVKRNENFQETLLNASLMIYDDIETPFVEALYVNKPFILILDKNRFLLRETESYYFELMEQNELIFYDYEKAASRINQIYNDIGSWWNDSKRQEVVKIIRERYCMKVDDPKEWWYKEFKRQLKLCKHNKVEYE